MRELKGLDLDCKSFVEILRKMCILIKFLNLGFRGFTGKICSRNKSGSSFSLCRVQCGLIENI